MTDTIDITASQLAACFSAIRRTSPLVHCMTNYVTVNDVANALLAVGASPIMSDDIDDIRDITTISSVLVINIGTLNARTIASMLEAGKIANAKGTPVILDPVGAGASQLRNDTTRALLDQVHVAAVRGNISELGFIAGLQVATKGVDAAEEDTEKDAAAIATTVATTYRTVAAVTGAVDVIATGSRVLRLGNGTPVLKNVTGTGCMTSALVGAAVAATRARRGSASDENDLVAVAAAVSLMGIAGEIAQERSCDQGTGSFHVALIDALSTLDDAGFESRVRIDG
jgi:hydroxyethylthiazole kinase